MKKTDSICELNYKCLCLFLFVIFSIIYRILLPFGDEPDFFYRTHRFINNYNDFLSPYVFVGFLIEKLNINSNCEFHSSPFTILSELNFRNCMQSLEQIVYRLLIQLYISIPIFLLIVISFFKNKKTQFDENIDAFLLSIITPSYLYYYSVLGVEPFMLLVSSLLLFFKDNNKWVMFLICLYVMTIDIGDSFVVLFFVSSYLFIEYCIKRKGIGFTKIMLCIILLFAFILGPNLLSVFSYIGVVSDKLFEIESAYSAIDYQNKYPVIIRPVITYMTLIFGTAWSVKSVIAYILVSLFLIYTFFKSKKVIYDVSYYSSLYTPVFVVLFFVFIFPTYANAKYYIFMMPFFISSLLYIHSKKSLVLYMVILNIVVSISLVMSYLNWS